jgi:hypothetical protein
LEGLQQFCHDKNFADGEIVNENKLLFFLNERVLGRKKKVSRSLRTISTGEPIKQTIGTSSIELYCSAIIDIWSEQKGRNQNPYENPRGKAIRAILDDHTKREAKRKRDQYEDRGAGTLQDG